MKGLPQHEISIRVVGITFRDGYPDTLLRLNQMMQKMTRRVPVQLRREPDNPHDPNAVAVLIDGVHMGYLPSNLAKRAVHDLKRGVERNVYVENVNIHPDHLENPGLWILLEPATLPGS